MTTAIYKENSTHFYLCSVDDVNYCDKNDVIVAMLNVCNGKYGWKKNKNNKHLLVALSAAINISHKMPTRNKTAAKIKEKPINGMLTVLD